MVKVSQYENKVIEGDCLEVMSGLPNGAVDMILSDLPYGITQNRWDKKLDLQQLWREYKRIIKVNGAIVLTSQGRFTAELIMSCLEWFKYKLVWIKSTATNFLNANRQPLRRHEDICVFYRMQPSYFPQMVSGKPFDKGVRKASKAGNYGDFGRGKIRNVNGDRYPTDVLLIEEEQVADYIYTNTINSERFLHPTQKPVALGRWLIRSFSEAGNIVLDNCCGSGSFLVSAILEGRRFIGIEKNDIHSPTGRKMDMISVCLSRIEQAKQEANNLFK